MYRALLLILSLIVGSATSAQPAVSRLSSTEIAVALSQAFSLAAEKAKPSVANISTTTVIPGRRDPFMGIFEEFFGPGAFTTPAREIHSLGSGVVVREDGYIATNFHVVRGAQSIVVALGEDTEVAATLAGSDPASDLAVIKVNLKGLRPIEWGDSDALAVGEWVIAIGSPHGLKYSVTAGIVSAKGRRDVGITTFEDFIQTDATINPGNSGGALVNLRGELVGIPTAILSQSGGYEGVGFAIPSNAVADITGQLIQHGRYPRGWIGIIPAAVDRRRAELAGIAEGVGLVIDQLYRDSPAHRAGLLPGDIIVTCNKQPVTGMSTLVKAISGISTGGTVELGIVRLERVGEQVHRSERTVRVPVIQQPIDEQGRAPQGI
ncbi:MAG: S1C family serine protease [Candidatus Zipacnadales bacterium]